MNILICICIVVAILCIWCFIENHIFVVNRYTVEKNNIPTSFDGTKMIYIADLHHTSYGKNNMRLKKKIREEQPDYILIGGDFLSKSSESCAVAVDLLKELCELAPVYFENGNHETRMKVQSEKYHHLYEDFRTLCKGLSCTFLENKRVIIKRDNAEIALAGLELEDSYFTKFHYKQLEASDLNRLLGKADQKRFQMLLAHSPNFFDAYADWGADVTLSGHNHGGMARIPGVMGVFSTQAILFPKYTKGKYVQDDKEMIVSAGLGSHTIKIRFFNPPELLVITLKHAE